MEVAFKTLQYSAVTSPAAILVFLALNSTIGSMHPVANAGWVVVGATVGGEVTLSTGLLVAGATVTRLQARRKSVTVNASAMNVEVCLVFILSSCNV
jgi:hypothetical protein